MGRIGEILHGEIKGSREFSSRNYGLPMGSDWVETVRDVLEDETVCAHLMASYLKLVFHGEEIQTLVQQSLVTAKSSCELAQAAPAIGESAMEFFYWGVQVGRRLEQEEMAALKAIAEGGTRGA